MYLKLNHQRLEAYKSALALSMNCYQWTSTLPPEERFNLVQQIRRAAISVILNLAEGCSRKSAVERKRFFEISRGSMIEIDAALDIANELGYGNRQMSDSIGEPMIKCFGAITGLIKATSKNPLQ